MTIPAIVRQLQRLVPHDQFQWEVRQMGHNIYQVQFPTRNDLERLKIFGLCRVPNSTCELTFDSWAHNPTPTSHLPEAWVRVSGIPGPHLGDFLAMWAVGDMFGITRQIDMAYTREHGVLRIRIGCLNHSKIPKQLPLFIKDGFYNLSFVVEQEELAANPDDMVVSDSDDKEDDEDRLGDDFRDAVAKYWTTEVAANTSTQQACCW